MKPLRPPRFETRRAKELEAELVERARAWIPSWGMDDDERDFGRALLKIAARFSSEVAERLDRAGEKIRLGFLDWLAVQGEAARPARLPVVFKLTDSAREAKPATASTRLQVDAAGASVILETETDVLVLPRGLQVLVGVDGAADAFFLAPPGLSSLAPLEPLPTQWQLKSFASNGGTTLQLDPEQGLAADMLVELGGKQYRITQVNKDIVTLDPPLAQDHAAQSVVTKVSAFMPFDGAAHNRQEHALYIGHKELFDIEAAATIEITGARQLAEAAWHYWGKTHPADEIGWQELPLADAQAQAKSDGIVLTKPKGSMEVLELVKGSESRWIRASVGTVKPEQAPLLVDAFEIRINCGHGAPLPPSADPASAPFAEAMANTIPLVLDNVFFPLGKEPRQFDAFYLGSKEAFSKKSAEVVLDFEMADTTFTALTAVREGGEVNAVLAGVAQDGALHLLNVNPATGSISEFLERGPLRPPPADGNADSSPSVMLDRRPQGRLPVWHDTKDDNDFLIAAAAGDAVWVWREKGDRTASGWVPFGTVPAPATSPTAPIADLVYLADISTLFALRGGQLSKRKWPGGTQWSPVETKDGSKPVLLDAIVPVLVESADLLVTSSAPNGGLVGVGGKKLYKVSPDGACMQLSPMDVTPSVRPVAVRRPNGALIIALAHTSLRDLVMFHSLNGEQSIQLVESQAKVKGFEAVFSGGDLYFLASVQLNSGGYLASWTADTTTPGKIELSRSDIPASIGQPDGAPTEIARYVVIPGARGDLLVAAFEFAGRLMVKPASTAALPPSDGSWARRWLGDTTTQPELSWEYWDGTGWWKLDVTRDETQQLKKSGALQFKVPLDLAPTNWSGRTNYWIRARLVAGDYGRETVSVANSPPDRNGVAHQTVERSTKDIHAPTVLKLGITYEICEAVPPTFLMTKDSASLRDQSDANRTAGAKLEAFVPLALLLGRLASPPAAAAVASDCKPDCQCPGTAADTTTAAGATSTLTRAQSSAAAATGARAPASTLGRAIYLGFDAPLLGEPINVLLLVEERPHDEFAPMSVEALVADRFVPIIVNDATRALGESGVLSLAFPIEPTPRELFGQTLSWLRLTPAAGTPSGNWKPKVLGAYLNGVWASAAETLTRELIGSSQGEPNLTLYLARPPVLRNTLKLRVNEPLGEEELDELKAERADQVLTAVENLPGNWVLWKHVIDPGDEAPTARVYALDEATGEIRFGDGQHGRIPPVGRDSIMAFTYRRSEPGVPGGLIVPGNAITARTSLNLVSPIDGVEAVFAADQAAGGAAPEDADRVLRFGVARLRHRERALTAGDVEDFVLESSPDFAQARCLPRNGFVQLVVVMRGANPIPTAAQVRELHRLLEANAPPALSARAALRIGGPTLRRLRVDLRLRVASLDDAGAVARGARKGIIALFDTATGGVDGDGWPLGENPTEADVAVGLADVPKLDGIAAVALREIADDGSEQPWPDSLKRTELPWLEKDGVRIEFETVKVVA